MSFNNIQQITVLKGPQGTLFGRNATGGLIQIVTRDPRDVASGELAFGYGNHATITGSAYLTGPVAPHLAADIALYYNNQQHGFGHNLVTGHDVGNGRDFAARTKWKWDIGPDTTARVTADYEQTIGNYPVYRLRDGTLGSDGKYFPGGPFDGNTDVDPKFKSYQGGVSLDLKHDFGGVKLDSITAYRKVKFDVFFDVDSLPEFFSKSRKIERDHQFSQEVHLLSPDTGPFKWVVGAYYFKGFSSYDPQSIITPATTRLVFSRQRAESFAVFAQSTWQFAKDTSLTTGIRYTWETKKFDGHAEVTPVGGTTTFPPPVVGKEVAKKPTWRLALDHKFSDTVLGYISYNRGFKSGGFSPQQVTPPLVSFKPEVLDAFEAGLKSDLLDHHLRINAAAFYYDYKEIQLVAFINNFSTVYNAASAKVHGLDVDVTARPFGGLTLTGGVSILNSKFGDFPGASLSIPKPTGGNRLTVFNAKGDRLPLTPKWTANIGADYEVNLGSHRLLLSGNFYHNDGWYAEADNRLFQHAYNLVNASATLYLDQAGKLSVRAWGKNLFNKDYAAQLFTLAQGDGINIAPGRSFGVTFGALF
jgi:iron complex outermembrane receptor protein